MKVRFSTCDPPEVIDPHIADLAACLSRSKKTVVITGAGISCNSGIPVSTWYLPVRIKNGIHLGGTVQG